MYNANKPVADELPSSARLLRSTAIAIVAAAAILLTVVLPSEYGIDPTGAGRVLGLTEMGEIKIQLAEEAGADAAAAAGTASAEAAPPTGPETRSDEISITLSPGQGTEIKLVMDKGAQARFEWTANGGLLNYDTHGDGGGQSISYEKGRGVPGDEGLLVAAFNGNHGWFWRNRTKQDVTLTLRTNGAYRDLKRVL
ncbi:MAG: transmembrane anchor protein [Minwuiales bacterium]|nr:transmembrane anchor protein [Minwuiales bacterium]